MTSVTIPRTITAAAVLIAAVLVLVTRGRDMSGGPAVEVPRAAPSIETTTEPTAQTKASDASETPAAAKLRELVAMSETYRNTTFLIAIRDSGFVCNELLGVYGGVNDSLTWTATCSQLLAYTVRIASAGNLHVEPMLEHSDGLGPRVEQRFDDPTLVLPPPPRR